MESSTFSAIQQELAHLPRTTFGVSIPALRKLAQKIAKGNYQDFLKHNPNHTHEERLLHAFVIGYIQADIKELLRYFKAFIPYVDSWDVTDSLCQNFKMARQFPQETWHFVLQYKNSSKEFESRLVSVILLSHFLNDVYVKNLGVTRSDWDSFIQQTYREVVREKDDCKIKIGIVYDLDFVRFSLPTDIGENIDDLFNKHKAAVDAVCQKIVTEAEKLDIPLAINNYGYDENVIQAIKESAKEYDNNKSM